MDKVLFSYPTLLREGMEASQIYSPEPLISGVKSGSIHQFIVTAGLMLDINKFVITELDILFEGQGMVLESEKAGRVEHPVRRLTNTSQIVYLSSMFLNEVQIDKSGCYTILIKLYLLDENHQKTDTVLDTHTSFFYVMTEEGD
jgi:hypothetical protein